LLNLDDVHRLWPKKTTTPAERDTPEPLSLEDAVRGRLTAGHRPGKGGNEQWERFCDEVRKRVGKKQEDRGYGDKTIQRIVRKINNRTSQPDK
jgi:hypothetical protein